MFGREHYVPILKSKLAEHQALRVLPDEVKSGLTPMLEISPIPWDHDTDEPAKTVDQHLARVVGTILSCWGAGRLFLDTAEVNAERMKDTTHPLAWLLAEARKAGLQIVPVVTPDADQELQMAAAGSQHGACLRLDAAHCQDPSVLAGRIDAVRAALGLKLADVDLVLDLGAVGGVANGTLVLAATGAIGAIPRLTEWRSFTLAASAFPVNLSEVRADTSQHLPRSEWQLWQAMAQKSLPRIPTFGDYAIAYPEPFEAEGLDPRLIKMSANLRYTCEATWLVLRGRNVRDHGYDQFVDLCHELVQRDEFKGRGFSWGDEYIDDCAKGQVGAGSAMTWRKIGTSHHLTCVVRQIASLGAS